MEKNLVIGGSGFVGTRLIDLLGKENCVNIDKRVSDKYNDITIIQDIRNENMRFPNEKISAIILLAAEHADNVFPISLYYDVNVQGAKNVVEAAKLHNIKTIIFTSSVSVYGINVNYPTEEDTPNPFNHYGKSKLMAENVLKEWYDEDNTRRLFITRFCVIFGELNRGNVYNLLCQISSKKFLQIGSGKNKKSMAYVGNVAAYLEFLLEYNNSNYLLLNYADTPDLNMNQFVDISSNVLNIKRNTLKIPYHIGILGGYLFDLIAFITRRKYSISSLRVKKFCMNSTVNTNLLEKIKFIYPYSMKDALIKTINHEFIDNIIPK